MCDLSLLASERKRESGKTYSSDLHVCQIEKLQFFAAHSQKCHIALNKIENSLPRKNEQHELRHK